MPKKPDERIVQAKQMYLDGMKLVEIASQLSLPEGTVRRWKSTHKWDNERSDKNSERSHRKRGGQPGNSNATGPPGNKHAEKHGFFSKWLPAETLEIINTMSEDPLELLWDQVTFQYAAIVRAQNLMYVKDQEDKTVEKVGESFGKVDSETWTVQQAWDKHSTFMSAQARSVKAFLSTVKEYEELLNKRWDLATDEQKARIAQIKAQTSKLEDPDKEQPINITFVKASEAHDDKTD
ncbi:MAG: phage terminase small subunit [Erysipelotrichaceae bacterium]